MKNSIESILESFSASPGTNFIDVLANSGYSLQAAIADIVDNCIPVKASEVHINMVYDGEESYISIVDNGYGMNLEQLKNASILAYKDMMDVRKVEDLGRFSTGINSASSSMCSHLLIQSISEKDRIKNTISVDYKKIKESGVWTHDVIKCDDNYVGFESGTAIVWKNLKDIASATSKKEFYNKIEIVEKHLSHVFNDYISNGLKIFINSYEINGWDPFYKNNIKTTKIYDEVFEYHNSKISVKTYILPPYNNLNTTEQVYMKGYGLSDQQGFYIYRQNRLIKEGGWLGFEDLSIANKYDYARIRIDIPNSLDEYFKPNFLKNEIFIPDDLKEIFRKIANNARKESRNSFNYMKAPRIVKTVKEKKNIPVWNRKESSDGLLLSINENHPLIKSLCIEMSEKNRKRLFNLISTNIPIGEMNRTGVSDKQNDYSNIEMEMEDLYGQLIKDGLSNDEIMAKMSSCEPFCLSTEMISILIDFLGEKGVL